MTDRFQFSLTLALAIGFGGLLAHTLIGPTAIGYPAGPAVSAGTNPVFSTGGEFSFNPDDGTSSTVLTAPADQDLVITDVEFSVSSGHMYCGMRAEVDLYVDGEQVGAYTPMSSMMRFYSSETAFLSANNAQQTLSSGIRIPADSSLVVTATRYEWGGSYCSSSYTQSVRYTLSGYQAQP